MLRTRLGCFSIPLIWSLSCASAPASAPPSPPRLPFEIPRGAASSEPTDLLQALSSPDGATRAASAWALASARGDRSEFGAALEPLRSDSDRSVRYAVAWALGRLKGPTVPEKVGPGEVAPKVRRTARPVYPPEAFNAKIEGTVLIEALIGEFGEVAHAEVRRSVPGLDTAALQAVVQWDFEPMQVNGLPRATVIQMPVAFRIY